MKIDRLQLLVLFAGFLFYGCNAQKSNEEKVKTAVKDYIIQNSNDPKSYEEVEWSSIDTVYATYGDSEDGRAYHTKIKSVEKQVNSLEEISKNSTDPKDQINYQIGAKHVLAMYDTLIAKKDSVILGHIAGYSINHKMRGKNAMGALVLSNVKFILDTNFAVVKSENTDFKNLK